MRLVLDQGIDVVGVNFSTGFCLTDHSQKVHRKGEKRPIYFQTACHGHFGREGFTWEETNRIAELQEAVAAAASA